MLFRKTIITVMVLYGFLISLWAGNIHDAVKQGDKAMTEELLNADPGLIDSRDNDGKTPLHIAAEYGRNEMIELLLSRKADVNSKTVFNLTPLHFAAAYGRKNAVELLIAKGADLNIKDIFNITPLANAISGGHIEVVRLLLSKGADINVKGTDSMTFIHNAASTGRLEIARTLIEKGMDVNVPNDFGKTPLHFACAAGHKAMVLLLIEKGAKINARGMDGRTPLHSAAEGGRREVVELLTAKGADTAPRRFPVLKGEFLGQKKPGLTPGIFAPGIVSTEAYEFAGSFSPDGNEYYFTRRDSIHAGGNNTIWVTRVVNDCWTEPEVADFSGRYFDFEPFITPNGKKLYFGSHRPLEGNSNSTGLHQWFLEKTGPGWSAPKSLGAPFRDRFVMYPAETSSGAFYFTGMNEKQSFELHVARMGADGKYQNPVKLGSNINMFPYIAHPFAAPDESYLIFDAMPDAANASANYFYISFMKKDAAGGAWSNPKKMPDQVNTGIDLMCASVSPDGKYFFFAREGNIYWVDAKIIESLKE